MATKNLSTGRIIVASVTALTITLGGLTGCSGAGQTGSTSSGGSGAHGSRVRFYDSLKAITKDSTLVVVGTAGPQTVADDLNTGVDFTRTEFGVSKVLKHKGELPQNNSIIVRQDGSNIPAQENAASQSPSTPLLESGKTYMLFLTVATGLPGELASQYYVTGANAGLYMDAATAPPVTASAQSNSNESSAAPLRKLAPGTFVPTDPSPEDDLPSSATPSDVEAVAVSIDG